jgi:hypothetical protein
VPRPVASAQRPCGEVSAWLPFGKSYVHPDCTLALAGSHLVATGKRTSFGAGPDGSQVLISRPGWPDQCWLIAIASLFEMIGLP